MEERIIQVLEEINKRMYGMESQLKEHTQLLRAMEHALEVNRAEHDQMMQNIAEIAGEVKAFRKDMVNLEIITASNWSDLAKLKAVK